MLRFLLFSMPPAAFMKINLVRFAGMAVFLAAGQIVLGSVNGETTPYDGIAGRNVFRLSTPPVSSAPATNSETKTTLRLTGLMRVSGQRPRAFFSCVGSDQKEAYYSLCEGDRDGSLELIRIVEEKGAAEVLHEGKRMTVALKEMPLLAPASVDESGLPKTLANLLSADQRSQLLAALPTMSSGQIEALEEDAKLGRVRMIRTLPPRRPATLPPSIASQGEINQE